MYGKSITVSLELLHEYHCITGIIAMVHMLYDTDITGIVAMVNMLYDTDIIGYDSQ